MNLKKEGMTWREREMFSFTNLILNFDIFSQFYEKEGNGYKILSFVICTCHIHIDTLSDICDPNIHRATMPE